MNSDVIQKISNMTQPMEKRTWRIRSRPWWLTWLPLLTLGYIVFGTLGYIGSRGIKEILLEGGPIGALLFMLAWTAVWTIGLRKLVTLMIGSLKVIASSNPKEAVKNIEETIQSLAADPSNSDQSLYSKLPETLSLRGDNSISGNNSADASVEDIIKSAKKRDAGAQYNLGLMYYYGRGVPQNYEKAIDWFTKSAEQDNAWAQNNLGLMYDNGRGAPQDYEKAIDWFTKSAEQDFAWAQYNLGLMYDNGRGVPQDYEKAIDWYTKSAEQGNAWAQNNLGLMYAEEKGTPQDDKQAVHWLTKSAEQSFAAAQSNLGVMYANGRGVPPDDKRAVHWYTKSAKQGNAVAQYNLGLMYEKGKGLMQNYKKAYMWFNLAIHNGYSDEQKTRDTVAKKLSSQDLIEAQEMAERCHASGYENC